MRFTTERWRRKDEQPKEVESQSERSEWIMEKRMMKTDHHAEMEENPESAFEPFKEAFERPVQETQASSENSARKGGAGSRTTEAGRSDKVDGTTEVSHGGEGGGTRDKTADETGRKGNGKGTAETRYVRERGQQEIVERSNCSIRSESWIR